LAPTRLSSQFNVGLASLLGGLEAPLPLKIFRLDVFSLVHEVVADPLAFGLTEVETPCITPFTRVSPYCTRPERFLFWDFVHPTQAGHAILPDRALEVLGGT